MILDIYRNDNFKAKTTMTIQIVRPSKDTVYEWTTGPNVALAIAGDKNTNTKTYKCTNTNTNSGNLHQTNQSCIKGIVHNFFVYRSNLIFWIVMGCDLSQGPCSASPGPLRRESRSLVINMLPHPITIQNMIFER